MKTTDYYTSVTETNGLGVSAFCVWAVPTYGIPGHELSGKPSIYGSRLYVSNRFWGKVSVVDISRPEKPKLLRSFQLDGNPGIAVEHNNMLIIPGGYQGLLVDFAGD